LGQIIGHLLVVVEQMMLSLNSLRMVLHGQLSY